MQLTYFEVTSSRRFRKHSFNMKILNFDVIKVILKAPLAGKTIDCVYITRG